MTEPIEKRLRDWAEDAEFWVDDPGDEEVALVREAAAVIAELAEALKAYSEYGHETAESALRIWDGEDFVWNNDVWREGDSEGYELWCNAQTALKRAGR